MEKIRDGLFMNISKDIIYLGVNDHEIDLFEGQYVVPNGMAYNSYAIVDKKIAVVDGVDGNFVKEWLDNIANALNGKTPDYLIVQHMEPDHSASIFEFTKAYPDAKIVSNSKSFTMMKNFFGVDFSEKAISVTDGSTLSLGNHELSFITAPMVHWPEVIMTYDKTDKVLFSADAFGKFGALDTEEDWACEARRYYFGIVGKYGVNVQGVLKKASNLDIATICPLHGPVLTENLGYYLDLYNTWSSYTPEKQGVTICYTSVYGNTKKAVMLLAKELEDCGVKVALFDLARDDMAEAVEDAFKYSKLVLATTTYNGSIFPFMNTFIETLVEHNYQNRKVAFIENGTWAPIATKLMKAKLENCKNLEFVENGVKILSSVSEQNIIEIKALAQELK